MEMMGKTLIGLGAILVVLGLILTYWRYLSPVGRLPGDIYVQRGNFTFYFPIATSIILTILLSVILFVIALFLRVRR